ncbi:hypothetical protein [Rhizobium sp. BG4]|uniref:hypothetical protein n=1 Tax=Rhizobium sp. BG4 TaxID=2613770 RepID=UPI00193D07EB|nr:hypothetical protein [Rhizobium sp. BG4]QRM45118.1 hypothetical protein F2982_17745 [Rhizobium sp. BG4]
MKTTIFVVGLPLLLGSCAATLPPDVVASSDVDETYSVRPVQYASPISGYTARQPVDPKPWRRQDNRTTKQEGGAS